MLDDTGLPTHKPLSVLLSLKAFERRALRPLRPLAFPMQGDAPSDAKTAWQLVDPAWATALARPGGPDIDAMWVQFCTAAEAYLLAKQVHHLDRPPKRYLGRASCAAPRTAPVVAPQGRGTQCGALTHRHLRLLKLLRRLEAHYQARLRQPLRPGPLPYTEMHRWTMIHRTAADLLATELLWVSRATSCTGRPPHDDHGPVRATTPSPYRQLDHMGPRHLGLRPPGPTLRLHPRQHLHSGHPSAAP